MPVSTHYQANEASQKWMDEEFRRIAAQASELYQRPIENYGAPRLAPYTPDMESAERLSRNTGAYAPFLNESLNLSRQAAAPTHENYRQYQNPYQNDVVNRMRDEARRNFEEVVMPQLSKRFAGMGQHGSKYHGNLALRASQGMERDLLGKQAELLHNNFQNAHQMSREDLNRKLNVAKQLEGLGIMSQAGNLSDVQALMGVGQQRRQHNQNDRNIAYEDWKRRQAEPWNRLHQYSAVLERTPLSYNQLDVTQNPGQGEVNNWGNIGSIAGQLWAARMMGGR